MLVFDSGEFSEDGTFLVSELFERNPKSVLAKDLRVDTSALDNIPEGQLYILPGTPAPKNISEQNVTGPAGSIPIERTYSYHFSKQEPYEVPGGSVKLLDSNTFPVAKDFAVALFTIKPGAMRELHWHTTSDEWTYFISGQGRLTVYAAPASSRTFDFQAGDTGYVPVTAAHYLENTGTEDLVYLGKPSRLFEAGQMLIRNCRGATGTNVQRYFCRSMARPNTEASCQRSLGFLRRYIESLAKDQAFHSAW